MHPDLGEITEILRQLKVPLYEFLNSLIGVLIPSPSHLYN